ncbi:Ankyrin repeat domain-containing protein 50 [Colletotrichum sp. SAR 10_76]|nr:Ankyrin repeat domain-containing protein 50 [Colletotrichum sp. SAR 10_76]
MEENKTLLETRQHLDDVGFQVTKAQLEYKLKDWGFRKKIPKRMSDTVWHLERNEPTSANVFPQVYSGCDEPENS